MSDEKVKGKRIAKNTLILYFRMLFLMLITLYTSRVILEALGVDDFGVYNVVGGFVAMFAVLSKSLSSACSRFFNYEMGKGNFDRLSKVFSSTVTIQIGMAIVIALICEGVGYWFVNYKMVIPSDRIFAANCVLQFSIITFCWNLIAIPYNAAIIAHEKMKAFAYISLYEGVAKLVIAYLVMISPIDILIFYAGLICLLQFSVRSMYCRYCLKHFSECKYKFIYDKPLFKEIFGFASWNFIGSAAAILRTQGGNILINLFFGPAANAARAIATQVLHAVQGFSENFLTAMKPQITQSYAKGDFEYMMSLLYRGSRFSFYLLFFLSLPIILNAEVILGIWLKNVPDHAILFVQLTLAFAMLETLSHPLVTAMLATGNIRKYQLVVGGVVLLNLPISYVVYRMGGFVESFLIVAFALGIVCLFVRICMLRSMIHLKAMDFCVKVLFNVVLVAALATALPYYLSTKLEHNFTNFILNTIVCVACSVISIAFIGCNREERAMVLAQLKKIKSKLTKKK